MVVAAEAIVGVLLCLGAGATVVTVGALVYGLEPPADPVATAGWLVLGIACFVAIGLALGFWLHPSTASVVGNVVLLPMFLLGGGGPPRAVMVPVMRRISDLLPLTHITTGARSAWIDVQEIEPNPWLPATVAVVALLVAVRLAARADDTGR